jgi:hypothetical protein
MCAVELGEGVSALSSAWYGSWSNSIVRLTPQRGRDFNSRALAVTTLPTQGI